MNWNNQSTHIPNHISSSLSPPSPFPLSPHTFLLPLSPLSLFPRGNPKSDLFVPFFWGGWGGDGGERRFIIARLKSKMPKRCEKWVLRKKRKKTTVRVFGGAWLF